MGILIRRAVSAVLLGGLPMLLLAAGGNTPGKDKIIYTHLAHAQKYKVGACETCHRKITTSTRASFDHYSFQEGCAGVGCHNIKDKDSCSVCHTNVQGRTPPKPVREVEYSHKQHLDQKIKCTVCHTGLDTQRVFDRTGIPSMMICLHCHDKEQKTMSCAACHTDPELANTHGPDWKEEHGQNARDNADRCMVCHAASHCAACHIGKDFQAVHPANYEFIHGADVLGKGQDCQTCHNKTQFCDRCHRDKWGREPGKHHDYIKGSKSCTDCHHPHPKGNKSCEECHDDN